MRLATSISLGIVGGFFGIVGVLGLLQFFFPPRPIVLDASGFLPRSLHQAVVSKPIAYLPPDEFCLSGFVVRFSVVGGVRSYVQLSENGRPVGCVGNRRL
jgi:hypothetical protein